MAGTFPGKVAGTFWSLADRKSDRATGRMLTVHCLDAQQILAWAEPFDRQCDAIVGGAIRSKLRSVERRRILHEYAPGGVVNLGGYPDWLRRVT